MRLIPVLKGIEHIFSHMIKLMKGLVLFFKDVFDIGLEDTALVLDLECFKPLRVKNVVFKRVKGLVNE